MLLTNTIQAVTTRIQIILNGVVGVLRVRPAAPSDFAVAGMRTLHASRTRWHQYLFPGQLNDLAALTVREVSKQTPVGVRCCRVGSGCLS